jgi:hypothetical protein
MTADSSRWQPLSFDTLRTTSLEDRHSKVTTADFGRPWQRGGTFADFIQGLPDILAVESLTKVVRAIVRSVRERRPVILAMGAHPIKVGLNPVLIDALERRVLTAVALNGAGIVHDVEVALVGRTSEDVAAHLGGGEFGTARETAELIHGAAKIAHRQGECGLGLAVGRALLDKGAPFARCSLLATAAALNVPVTVHVALGTDIVHIHPAMDGAVIGALSYYDFRLFCRQVASLQQGVFINLGSAVILPEVFLKAVSVVTNLGFPLDGITTVNMDFIRHYRAQTNVVERPAAGKGEGLTLIGHHEIMFPLLMAAVYEELDPPPESQL